MNIDERIERLTSRHEALAESLQLFIDSTREAQQKNEVLLAAMMESIARLGANGGRTKVPPPKVVCDMVTWLV